MTTSENPVSQRTTAWPANESVLRQEREYATRKKIYEIFQIITESEQKLEKLYGQQNATLVFANSGSNKTIFTKWITNNDATLVSKTDPFNSSQHIIEDTAKHNTSEVQLPELRIHNVTGIAIYDFPDFNSTNGIPHDVSTGYFIKKVVEKVENVNLIFVHDYASLMNNNFKDMLKSAMMLMKNFDRFRDSIMLIVSKVTADRSELSYDQVIESLVLIMKKVIDNLQNEMTTSKVDNSRSMQFLEAILRKYNGVYPYLQLFWSPDENGLVSEIPLMRENRRNVTAALEKLNYAAKNDNDFGNVLPNEFCKNFDLFTNEVRSNISAGLESFSDIGHQALFYHGLILNDTDIMYGESERAYYLSSRWQAIGNEQKEPNECLQVIIDDFVSNVSSTSARPRILDIAMKYANYSAILDTFVNYTMHLSFKCSDALNSTVEYADKSRKWYKFLRDLYKNKLSTYDVQNILDNPCNKLTEFVLEEGKRNGNQSIDKYTTSSDELAPWVKKCDPQHEYDFKAITMDKARFSALYSLINMTMKHQVDVSCDSGKFLIKGQSVVLSDIIKYLSICQSPPKSIQVFAAHKLFLDQDFVRIGKIEVSFFAPTWQVLGNRKIALRGEDGTPLNVSKAATGKEHGQGGETGEPGLPGNPAGHFFGAGLNFINFENLTISSIGGQGGPGQHGGDGARGENGENAFNDLDMNETYPKTSQGHRVLNQTRSFHQDFEQEIYILQGHAGLSGGRGGDGGWGGWGGPAGTITYVPTYSLPYEFHTEVLDGLGGLPGNGGVGGAGGMNGKNGKVDIRKSTNTSSATQPPEILFTLLDDSTGEGPAGLNGSSNVNRDGIRDPTQNEPFLNQITILKEYVAYLGGYIDGSVMEFHLRNFEYMLNSEIGDSKPEDSGTTSISPVTEKAYSSLATDNNITSMEKSAYSSLSRDDINLPATNVAHNLRSPINTAMNLIFDFFVPFKFIYSTGIVTNNYKLIENRIKSMFGEPTSSQSNTYSMITQLDDFTVNGALVLADFLIRCVTKVKPYKNIGKPIDVSAVTAATLNIITEFEIVLKHLIDELETPDQSLQFDPIRLISELDKKLINRDYRNLAKILFESIDNKVHLDYANFKTYIQPKINQILGLSESEKNLCECCIGVYNENQGTNRTCDVTPTNYLFHRFSHHLQ